MTERIKAGTNEGKFAEIMRQKAPEVTLNGKRRFTFGEVSISVDQSLEYNGIRYLIEIDSQNIAKLLVGQYVLLNHLYDQEKEKALFLVVHAYKNYEPHRTIKNLQVINQILYSDKGIPFGAIHLSMLDKWEGGFSSFNKLIMRPEQKTQIETL